jgi:dihydrofolate reductase
MPIALIVAAAGKNLVIGKDGDLPWHFSADLKYFKEKTMGHPVLMGRVTYQSILNRLGKPLPGRRNIVLSRDPAFHDDRATVIRDLLEISHITAPEERVFVIGGASLYRQTLDLADTIYLTHIDRDFPGDSHFPALDSAQWQQVDRQDVTEKDTLLRFCTYRRTGKKKA